MNSTQVIFFLLIVTASFLMTINKSQYKITEWESEFREAGEPYAARGQLRRVAQQAWDIQAQDEPSAAFQLAYAACENDFRGLQLLFAQSKALSGKAVDSGEKFDDFLFHWMGLREAAVQGAAELTPEERELVTAYATGMNHYAATHSDQILHGVLYPITEEDIVAHYYYLIQDIVHLKSLATVMWSGAKGIPVIPRQEEPLSHQDYERIIRQHLENKIADLKKEPTGAPKGSTAYAMGPGRASEGQTFLAINPHQKWAGEDSESSYFRVTIRTETGWRFTGLALPGLPVPLMGHNTNLGWAHTVNHPDLIDLFVLDVNPANPDEYRYDDKWIPFEKRHVEMPTWIANVIPWTLHKEILSSVYGPVVRMDDKHVMALSYSGFDSSLAHFVGQYFDMSRASTWEEWLQAHQLSAMPLMSTVYADHEGNIYYHYGARTPKRDDRYVWRFAVPADSSDSRWGEYFTYQELPHVLNPSSHFLYDCNSSPFYVSLNSSDRVDMTNYPPALELDARLNNRALRFHELLAEMENQVSWEAFCDLKYDWTYSSDSLVAQYVQRLIAECDRALRLERPWAKGLSHERLEEAKTALEEWDYQADVNNTRAALPILTVSPFLQADVWSPDPAPWVDGHFEMVLERFHSVIHRLQTSFGRLDVPWGRVHRLIREGMYDIPMAGGPDLLYNHRGQPYNDILRITSGDNLFFFVSWNAEGYLTRSQVGDIYFEAASARENHSDPARQLRATSLLQELSPLEEMPPQEDQPISPQAQDGAPTHSF